MGSQVPFDSGLQFAIGEQIPERLKIKRSAIDPLDGPDRLTIVSRRRRRGTNDTHAARARYNGRKRRWSTSPSEKEVQASLHLAKRPLEGLHQIAKEAIDRAAAVQESALVGPASGVHAPDSRPDQAMEAPRALLILRGEVGRHAVERREQLVAAFLKAGVRIRQKPGDALHIHGEEVGLMALPH